MQETTLKSQAEQRETRLKATLKAETQQELSAQQGMLQQTYGQQLGQALNQQQIVVQQQGSQQYQEAIALHHHEMSQAVAETKAKTVGEARQEIYGAALQTRYEYQEWATRREAEY